MRFVNGASAQDPAPYTGALSRQQMAAMLYRSGHHRAAKELLCDERGAYDEFKRAGSPCQVRPLWEATGADGKSKPVFDPAAHESTADCLTAAHAAQAPLAACQRR